MKGRASGPCHVSFGARRRNSRSADRLQRLTLEASSLSALRARSEELKFPRMPAGREFDVAAGEALGRAEVGSVQ